MCDRHKDDNIPKSQIGFFKFVIAPFYSLVADLIDPKMQPWLNVQTNLRQWQRLKRPSVEAHPGAMPTVQIPASPGSPVARQPSAQSRIAEERNSQVSVARDSKSEGATAPPPRRSSHRGIMKFSRAGSAVGGGNGQISARDIEYD